MNEYTSVQAVKCEIAIGICGNSRPMLVGVGQNEEYPDCNACKLQCYRHILHLWVIRRSCPRPIVRQGSIWLDIAACTRLIFPTSMCGVVNGLEPRHGVAEAIIDSPVD